MTNAIRGALGAANGLLASPPPGDPELRAIMEAQITRANYEFGLYSAQANRMIWRRWYSPLTDGIRELRRRREARSRDAEVAALEVAEVEAAPERRNGLSSTEPNE